jgi:hypothetical protein
LEIRANGGASRCIVIMHINRYCAICRQGLFQAYSGHNLIENKLYLGTSDLCYWQIIPPAPITASQPLDHCDGYLESISEGFWEHPAQRWMKDFLWWEDH